MPEPGYVYVLTNPEFPRLLKIGRTTRTPEIRAKELSNHTGVPRPYVVRYSRWFPDHEAAERHVHAVFADKRVRGKEFFRADLDEVIAVISEYQPSIGGRVSGRGALSPLRIFWVVGITLLLSIGLTRCLTEQRNSPQRTREARVVSRTDNVDAEGTVGAAVIERENEPDMSVLKDRQPILEETSAVFFSENDDLHSALWFEQEPGLPHDYQVQSEAPKGLQLEATLEKQPENGLKEDGRDSEGSAIESVTSVTPEHTFNYVGQHANRKMPKSEITTDNFLPDLKPSHATESPGERHRIAASGNVAFSQTDQETSPIEVISSIEKPSDEVPRSVKNEEGQDDPEEHATEEGPNDKESNDVLSVGLSSGQEM